MLNRIVTNAMLKFLRHFAFILIAPTFLHLGGCSGLVVDGMMANMVPTNAKLRRRRAEIDARLKPD